MSHRAKPPFRADHVGSLLRPRALIDAYKQHAAGSIDDGQFQAIQDEAVREAIALQEDAGLEAITDGEFRRASYWARFVDKVDGLEVREALFTFHDDHGHEQAFTAPHVAGKVKRSRMIAGDEFAFVKANTSKTPKVTLPSPPSMHFWRLNQGIDSDSYRDPKEFFADLAAVYRDEIAALANEGATYVQLDDVPFAMLCDPAVKAQVTAAGFDADGLVDDYVALFNDCLRDKPQGVTAAVHLCRGNYKGHFLSEGGYETIADTFFNKLDVDAFFLEYDSPRAGDFQPLRFVPAGKSVVLGLVSSKNPEMESSDELCRRVDEAARHIDLDQLCLSPQCGFASTVAGNPVTMDDERAKLSLIVSVADQVWG